MNRLIAWAWRYMPGIHPEMEHLVAYAERRASRHVREHLRQCRHCSQLTRLMRGAIESARQSSDFPEDHTAVLLRETYKNLQLRMRSKYEHSRRLADALEFYFGQEIAKRVEDGPTAQQLDLYTKPFFTAFLGKKAAEALVQQIAGALT